MPNWKISFVWPSISIAEPLWNLDKKTIDISVDALFLDESVALVRISDDLEVVSLRTRPEYDAY